MAVLLTQSDIDVMSLPVWDFQERLRLSSVGMLGLLVSIHTKRDSGYDSRHPYPYCGPR